jgi:hypothetical protein
MYDPQNMNAPPSGGPGCELENAAVYTPDLENMMSFFHPGCNTMSFEQEQFQVMRYNLLNHQEISKTVINTNPIFITIDTNFDQYRCSHKDIIVSNNSVLNIKDILTMAKGTKIVVERGSKLIVDGGIITGHCGDQWKGIFIEGNPYYIQGTGPDPSGEVVLNGATIENAEVGVTTYTTDIFVTNSGGLLSATNAVIKNCDIGLDFGSFGYLGWTIQDDASYIDNCTFDNCIIGIKANWNRGVETIGCTFNNTGTAIDLGTSSMLIDDNTFSNSTNFGVYSHHNWPQLDALTLTNNTFATGFTDVILSGPGNILSLDINNNSFFSIGGLDNYGLTSGDIVNNDFIGNYEAIYSDNTSSVDYDVDLNFFSGNNYPISVLGENAVLYNGNCFEIVGHQNIEINDNSSIGLAQGEDGGTEAGNCFDKTVPSMVTGSNTDFFTYHIKDDTPQADCKHPGNPGIYNWGLEDDASNPFTEPCGSNFTLGIPSSLFNCIVPQDEEDQLAFIDSLNYQILSIQADTTLTTYQQNWLTQRLKKCLKKVEGNYVRDRMQETDGKEKVMVFLQTSTDFDLNILAYGLMMNDSDFQNASNYLQSLMTTSSSGQSDFKESQFIYVNHLRTGNPVTQSDMDIIYDNAIERNPYSCFSRSIYYTLTGTRIDLPDIHINSNQPRIQNEAVEEEELYTVYPNPIRDNELYLESSRQVDVVVMDLSGRVIYHNAQLKESVKVVLNDHIDNIYLVRFTDTKGKVTYKKVIRI